MSQITRCPSCTTLFKVVPDQLRISEGWVRCGHCGHVFDATQHLQSAPPSVAPAVADTTNNTASGASPTALAATRSPPAPEPPPPEDPWEIPLPPPPAPPSPEEVATAPQEVLDFAAPDLDLELDVPVATTGHTAPAQPPAVATPDAVPAASNIDLDWPEAPPPPSLPAPVPAPPVPAPQVPTPIPAASIPTDIDWPEPALDVDADRASEAELAHAAEAESNPSPVMPELDLAPMLAPLPTPEDIFAVRAPTLPIAPSDERIEPSGPLEWSETPVPTPRSATPMAAAIPSAAPSTTAPPTAATESPQGKRRAPAPPASTSTEAPTPEPSPDEPSFVRAARRQALWRKPAVRLGLSLLAIMLLLGLLGQILVHDRHRLAASQPSWRPMLELLCAPLDCTVRLHRQIGAVVVESSSFNRVDGGVYHFAVTLKNRSALMLEMPAVELTLTDANEQAVVRRVFTPQELGANTTLAPQAEFSSTLLVRIATSNTPMAGYRVLAFYP